MSRLLQFLCRCISPDVHHFSLEKKNDVGYPNAGDIKGVEGEGNVELAVKGELLSTNCDQTSGALTDIFVATQRQETYGPTGRSVHGEFLAPLAEDEVLPPEQGLVEGGKCTVARRSSCPTIVAQDGASVRALESICVGQAVTRLHSQVATPKPSVGISLANAAVARSAASAMRYDFITLIRQASNRGSSGGIVTEATAPSPHPSWGAAADASPGAFADRLPAADWAAATSARHTYGNAAAVLGGTARRLGQRGVSVFAAAAARADGRGGADAAVLGPLAAGSCPPCPVPTPALATTFDRCSRSPDIGSGGLLLPSASGSSASGLLQEEPPRSASPYTAVLPPCANNGAVGKVYCGSGAGGGAGNYGSGGAPPPGGVLRSVHAHGGRSVSDLRAAAQPSLSPLRPRNMPRPAAATAPAIVTGSGHHSTFDLPKQISGTTVGGDCHVGRTPPGNPATGTSYQQARLLQQLRAHHHLQPNSAAAAAVHAVAAASASAPGPGAAPTASAISASKCAIRAGSTGSGRGVAALSWVEARCTTECASPTGAEAVVSEAVASPRTGDVPEAASAAPPVAGLYGLQRVSLASPECSDLLLPDGPSAALPSISTSLAAAPVSYWTDTSGGGGTIFGGVCSGGLPSIVPLLKPHIASSAAGRPLVGGGSQHSPDSSTAALLCAIVSSLGENPSAAGAACACAATHPTNVDAAAGVPSQAVMMIEDLQGRKALPDIEDSAAMTAAGDGSGGGASAAAMPLLFPLGALAATGSPRCSSAAGQPSLISVGRTCLTEPSPAAEPGNGQQQPGRPMRDGCVSTPKGDGAAAAVCDLPAPQSGNGNASGTATAAASPRFGPVISVPSRAAIPTLASIAAASLTNRSRAPLIGSRQPSERTVAATAAAVIDTAAASGGVAATAAAPLAALCLRDQRRLAPAPGAPPPLAAAAGGQLSTPDTSVCSTSPSRLLASPSCGDSTLPSTPGYKELQASLSMRSLPSQPSCGGGGNDVAAAAAVPVSSTSGAACLPGGEPGGRDMSCSVLPGFGGEMRSDVAAGSGPVSRGGNAFGVIGTGGLYGCYPGSSGGGGGVPTRCHTSVSTRRGSSVSESSLVAFALFRAAISNCLLPDDGGGGGPSSSHASVLHAEAATGISVVGGFGGVTTSVADRSSWLDTGDGAVAAAAASGGAAGGDALSGCGHTVGGSTADTRYAADAVLFIGEARSPALPALPSPAASALPSPGPSTGDVQLAERCSFVRSLRLEDGMLSDPLMLLDGLGQLSYMTSGAYAAVYRGTLERVPVGIKFLASPSLDMNAPAVKEALLGPGLEHDNIIRTYTTRVARVDGCAVARLRSVAAAMAAAAPLRGGCKRSSAGARWPSNGPFAAAAAGSPLSVPSTPLAAPPPAVAVHRRAAAAATEVARSPVQPSSISASPRAAAEAVAATSSAARLLVPLAPSTTGAAAAAAGVLFSPVCTAARSQLSVRDSPSKAVTDSAPCNLTYSDASSSAVHLWVSHGGAEWSNGQLASGLGMARGPGGPCRRADTEGAAEAEAAAAPRPMRIWKSVSSGARADVAGCREAETMTTITVRGTASATAQHAHGDGGGGAAAASAGHRPTLWTPQRRSSAHTLSGDRTPPPSPFGTGAPRARAPASAAVSPTVAGAAPVVVGPRGGGGGSAAERMLGVLRTLGVVGPTGHPTAEAHYVTAVVMEFAAAGNLDTFSRRNSPEPPCDLATAVDLLRQVAYGMSYLHAQGLVHGDLKPANVLLTWDPGSGGLVAKVADFGLSGLSGQQLAGGGGGGGAGTCGTLSYSAPERLAGAGADEEGVACAEQSADVYSFGICMQQLAAGVRPFAELTFGQVMFSVMCLKVRPPWPEARWAALQPLYDMCCHEQPSRRPNFDQILAWLESFRGT